MKLKTYRFGLVLIACSVLIAFQNCGQFATNSSSLTNASKTTGANSTFSNENSDAKIMQHPQSLELSQGDMGVFVVQAGGKACQNPKFRWSKNNRILPGETNSVLNIVNSTEADQGYYSVDVMCDRVRLFSHAAQLRVLQVTCEVENGMGVIVGNDCQVTACEENYAIEVDGLSCAAIPPLTEACEVDHGFGERVIGTEVCEVTSCNENFNLSADGLSCSGIEFQLPQVGGRIEFGGVGCTGNGHGGSYTSFHGNLGHNLCDSIVKGSEAKEIVNLRCTVNINGCGCFAADSITCIPN